MSQKMSVGELTNFAVMWGEVFAGQHKGYEAWKAKYKRIRFNKTQLPALQLQKTSTAAFTTGKRFDNKIDPEYSWTTATPALPPYNPCFTTEFFEVKPSPKGGLGAFAIKDIEKDTVIMAEEPLFTGGYCEVYTEHDKLTPEEKSAYDSLYGWPGLRQEPILARFTTNRFRLTSFNQRSGIFLKSSRFNHACTGYKTCTYSYNEAKNQLVTTAITRIVKGQEITIEYCSDASRLPGDYGFYCDCQACPPPKEMKAVTDFCSNGFW